MRHVPEILQGWTSVTGFDPNERVFNLGGMDVRGMSEAIRRAQDLDPGDALALMLLETFLDRFLSGTTLSLKDLLAEGSTIPARAREAQALRALLADSGLPEARASLRAWTAAALAHYGALARPEVEGIVADRDRLAFLRRDALDALDRKLQAHQFTQGEPDGAAPRIVDHVVEATSVPALLRAAAGMPSGILVALVRDPNPELSYFVLVARNGGTLTLLTDRPKWYTPFQRANPRRTDRALEDREAATHFPYGLLSGLHRDGEETPHGREVIAAGMSARRLCPIRDLPAQQTVWLAMLVDAVVQRYFREDRRLPQLSHVGAQLRPVAPDAAGLPAVLDGSLDVAPLRSSELDAERYRAETGSKPAKGRNAWMEARYRDAVDDSVLNLVSEGGVLPALAGPGGKALPAERTSRLMAVDADTFATRAEILKERAVLARHNQVLEINRLASEEFAARRKEVEDWWLRRMRHRRDALFAAIAAGSLPAAGEAAHRHGSTCVPEYRAEMLSLFPRADIDVMQSFRFDGVLFGDGEFTKTNWRNRIARIAPHPTTYCCIRPGITATLRARFSPHDAADLAILAGLPVSKLPDVVRNWVRKDDRVYVGNHLLDDIDPLDWASKNPWSDLDFKVEAWFSESGLAKLLRQHGGEGPPRALERKPGHKPEPGAGTGFFRPVPA